MKKNVRNTKGFTLIELLLYVTLTAAMLIAITVFISLFLEARVKNQVIAEVEQQGLQVMHQVTQTVRNAQSITSPAIGSSGASLTMNVVTSGDDPTVFDLSSGAIRIKEGAASAINLTSSRIIASTLNFQNLSRTDTPGVVRVNFTLTHFNAEGRQEYNFEKTFYTSASLRENE